MSSSSVHGRFAFAFIRASAASMVAGAPSFNAGGASCAGTLATRATLGAEGAPSVVAATADVVMDRVVDARQRVKISFLFTAQPCARIAAHTQTKTKKELRLIMIKKSVL